MDFAAAWIALELGAEVRVSNGAPNPGSSETSLSFRIWRSNNFTGELVERIDGAARAMRFDLAPNDAGNVIGFTVREDGGHSFEVT